jgi:class 3 adenylate cyclase
MKLRDVEDLVRRHFDEAADGIVDKAPSRLLRGEGTTKEFYILKIDLVGSTMLLKGRHPSTYLKLAHTYLSTVDQIALNFGADPEQMEYAGDSVLAYFDSYTPARDVMLAALWSRVAVAQLGKMPGPLSALKFRCKIVVDYDRLVMAKIGPRANSVLTAIGFPIHRVAKTEKDIAAGVGRASKAFFSQVPDGLRKFFSLAYQESASPFASTIFAPSLPPAPPAQPLGLMGGLAALSQKRGLGDTIFAPEPPRMNALANLLYPPSPPPVPAPPAVQRTHVGYDFKWPMLFREVGAPFSPD